MKKQKRVKIKQDGTLEYAPHKVIYNGKLIFNPSDEILDILGYKILIETEPLPKKDGYYEYIKYEEEGEYVVEKRSYREIIDPSIGHRRISKIFLRIILIKLGYIDQFENLLKTMEIPLGNNKFLNA